MSDTLDHSGLPEDDLLAAELALGVLEGGERITAGQRAARDRAFALLVEAWEQRLAPWAAEIREVSPPPQVWDRISSALPAQTTRNGLWHSLNFWRWLSFAAGALAAACLAGLIYLGTLTPRQALFATVGGRGPPPFVGPHDAGRGP